MESSRTRHPNVQLPHMPRPLPHPNMRSSLQVAASYPRPTRHSFPCAAALGPSVLSQTLPALLFLSSVTAEEWETVFQKSLFKIKYRRFKGLRATLACGESHDLTVVLVLHVCTLCSAQGSLKIPTNTAQPRDYSGLCNAVFPPLCKLLLLQKHDFNRGK